jgi:hypothetical protein
MRGYPRGLARGYFIPVASPDQGEPSCPPLEPPEQEPSRPCTLDRALPSPPEADNDIDPAKGDFILPWNP